MVIVLIHAPIPVASANGGRVEYRVRKDPKSERMLYLYAFLTLDAKGHYHLAQYTSNQF